MMDIVERLRDAEQWNTTAQLKDVVLFGQAADEIERLRQLGLKMRNAQKNYFKERSQENLIASKVAEKEFDDALKESE